jgi:hypothetical protein
VDEELLEHGAAAEQHLALVGEVAEERPLRQAGPLGDLGDRGALVAALDVQLQGGLLEAPSCVRLPSCDTGDRI